MFKALIAASGLMLVSPCERPPIEFQGPASPAVFLFADPDTVDAVCREASGMAKDPRRILACTNAERRVILMPDPCLYDDGFAKLACHEIAHLPRADGSPGWVHG